jgi:pteridine reductase|tara:strand:+ start:252 stop:1007 length:756 start_codon:yes stop_codon:yes gene_type:complete
LTTPETNLNGKWALITGAGKRLGECMARTLHQHGASIAIHYRSSEKPAQELADSLNGLRAGSAFTAQADLLNIDELNALVKTVTDKTGQLDILVNNASSFYPTPLGTVTEAQWHDLIGSNLKAPLFLAQAALPFLRATHGVIINIVDIHSQRPLKDHTVYGPSKAALAMLTKTLAKDLAPEVRVNGVSPGAILWPDEGMPEKIAETIIKQVPMKRVGDPTDIARTVLFLVKDAPYITGQIIAVDGGRSVGW